MSQEENIKGPYSFRYMTKDNRKIYLFGDMHTKSPFECPNSKSIVDVLNQVKEKYDLYIEGDSKHVEEEIELSNYLREVLALVKTTDIINVKYTDVRHTYFSFVFDATVYYDTLGAFSEFLNSPNIDHDKFNEFLIEFVGEEGLYFKFIESKDKIDQLINNVFYPLKVMGLDTKLLELKSRDPDLYLKLTNFLQQIREQIITENFIRNYNNIYDITTRNFKDLSETGNYTEDFMKTIKINTEGFYTLSNIIASISGLYMDIYLLYHLMTNKNVFNNVIYAGEWHCRNYYKFLKSCDYSLVYGIANDQQCISLEKTKLPLFSD